ncbi:MAG: very-short-patch-repair endonuclease [Arenicella sp.]|jgi:very-short-patch-repair endonuclease
MFRRDLRKNQTTEEAILWQRIRAKKLGHKFRRQHSFGNYILDFYCFELKFAIELDGAHHYTEEGREKDKIRDEFLENNGIKVLRIENKHILENLSIVLNLIEEECEERKD